MEDSKGRDEVSHSNTGKKLVPMNIPRKFGIAWEHHARDFSNLVKDLKAKLQCRLGVSIREILMAWG
ncbi:hypothetical protein CR513_40122, partial [Mucuna pruriens]